MRFFLFGPVKPIIGTSFPYSSVEPPIWLPKTQFMAGIFRIIPSINFKMSLREDTARFLHFCGTAKFEYQFYVLKSNLIIILTILAINEVFGSQIGGSTEL